MQFNLDTYQYDIVTTANDLGNATDATFPLAQKARFANLTMSEIWSWIFKAYGGWQYDDSNNTTTFPSARANLVINQEDYSLPSEAMSVRGVDIQLSGGVWQELKQITEEQIREGWAEKQFYVTAGVPLYYRPEGNSLKIYPKSNYPMPNGLRVSFDRQSVNFLPTDTTKQPGFASNFHQAVPTGMAIRYATIKHLNILQSLMLSMATLKDDIMTFYQARYQERFPPQVTVSDYTRENI